VTRQLAASNQQSRTSAGLLDNHSHYPLAAGVDLNNNACLKAGMLMLVQTEQSADLRIVMSEPIPDPPSDLHASEVVSEAVSTAISCDAKLPSAPHGTMAGLPKIIRFDSLARCGDEIWIENEGQIYRLRKTRQGKLILTK